MLTGTPGLRDPLNLTGALPHVDLDLQGQDRQLLLFKPVRGGHSFSAAVRQKVKDEAGLLHSDIAISILKIYKHYPESGDLLASMSTANQWANAASQPLILQPNVLPLAALMEMRVWSCTPAVCSVYHHEMLLGCDDCPESLTEMATEFMNASMAAGCDGLLVDSEVAKKCSDIIDLMIENATLQKSGDRLFVTPKGEQCCGMGQLIRDPKVALAVRDVPREELSAWELARTLCQDGWESMHAKNASAKTHPPVIGPSPSIHARTVVG